MTSEHLLAFLEVFHYIIIPDPIYATIASLSRWDRLQLALCHRAGPALCFERPVSYLLPPQSVVHRENVFNVLFIVDQCKKTSHYVNIFNRHSSSRTYVGSTSVSCIAQKSDTPFVEFGCL